MLVYAITSFISILIVVNPVGAIPLLLSLTAGEEEKNVRHIVRKSAIAVFFTLTTFTLIGQYILKFFNLSLGAINISGGIILLLTALDMLRAERVRTKSSADDVRASRYRDDISIVPLAVPMLAGPGSISTCLALATNADTTLQVLTLLPGVLFVGIITYMVLLSAPYLHRLLGQTGINTMSRLMGLLISALAIQMMIRGLAVALPQILAG